MSLEFPDVMLDIETTGLDKANCHIIQIAAVKFNLRDRTISHDFFDRCLLPAPNRFWEESCRNNFWAKRQVILNGLMARMEEPKLVLEGLRDWAGPDTTMCGKPTHFDHTFVDSYYQQHGMQIPFHYRKANDLNSFIRARYFPDLPPDLERELEFEGEMHNALYDCLHQVKILFAHVDRTTVGLKNV